MYDILKNKVDSDNIRYNTARALERLHHTAPPCYFHEILIQDWDNITLPFIKKVYAVRGYRRTRPEIAFYPPMFFVRPEKENLIDAEIIKQVTDLLIDLIKQKQNISQFVRVNCSLALIRWRETSDLKRIEQIVIAEKDDYVKHSLICALKRDEYFQFTCEGE